MIRRLLSLALMAILVSPAVAQDPLAPQDDAAAPTEGNVFGKEAKYSTPSADEVKQLLEEWLSLVTVKDAARKEIDAVWADQESGASGPELLKRITLSIGLTDVRAREVVDLCAHERQSVKLPGFSWLKEQQTHPLVSNNLRLLYGRWLCQNRLYDEALDQLTGLDPQQVVDPASLLFYRSVGHHRLLHKEKGLEAIAALLEDVSDSPRRYVSVASLMHDDLMALKDESLDHISRQMEDVERRLDLGRTGKKVRTIEDDIVKALDKMIEEEEKKQQQQQQQSSGSSGQRQSSSPAPDSKILGGTGPGHVDRRNVGAANGWGSLPPKERAEAMQQVGKDFPPHYREVIERYFRRLATEDPR